MTKCVNLDCLTRSRAPSSEVKADLVLLPCLPAQKEWRQTSKQPWRHQRVWTAVGRFPIGGAVAPLSIFRRGWGSECAMPALPLQHALPKMAHEPSRTMADIFERTSRQSHTQALVNVRINFTNTGKTDIYTQYTLYNRCYHRGWHLSTDSISHICKIYTTTYVTPTTCRDLT